jgi:hypothetical protein
MRRNLLWVLLGVVLLVSYIASSLIEFLVDVIWFDAVGYSQVFRTIVVTQWGLGLTGGLIAFGFLYVNYAYALRQIGDPGQFIPPELMATPLGGLLGGRSLKRVALLLSAIIGLLIGLTVSGAWETVLLYRHGGSVGAPEPVFLKDAGFYVFTLPLFDKAQSYLWSLGFVALLGVGATYLIKFQAERSAPNNVITLGGFSDRSRWHLAVLAAYMLALMAIGQYLNRFASLYEAGGLFTGPGYADIHGTIPVLALKAVTCVVVAGVVLWALPRQRYRDLIGGAVLLIVVWIGGNVYTSVLHRFVVSPNELEKERPFLKDHITATNKAFGLDQVIERPLNEDTDLTAKDIARNQATINNVRLWDHEPLLQTFAQIQEIRTYYTFVSVDNDRYRINGELRQVMLSPRELSPAALPSRTWVNERLTFTHGYGLTLGPVNRVNEQGLPVLYVKDLPPKSEYPELAVTQPEIYFGEVPDDYVFVKTHQKEFNYPEGDTNIFSSYTGNGGMALDSLYRRLLLALYLRDMKMLLAEDFTPETRIMLVRNVVRRVNKIAPFLRYDQDPYLVIDKGRLLWVMDGYTLSGRYPYSEQVPAVGNYIRNPVKVVIDAKNGDVDFYGIMPEEPLFKAYASMFPGLFKPAAAMPPGLRAHLRHPEDLFNLQASMYATYHMLDVNTFYNKEDQWSVPVVGQKRMQPYFTVMKLPGEKKEEFILMLPFTPRLKDNLSAWMVARMDGDNFGKLIVYVFPKQRLIFGPKQMVARINQDGAVSQQITLWDQSGSNVIRGTLLVIPIENSLIYVQPLYLKATDGKIPELKRVVVGYQNEIAMAEDLEGGLAQIFGSARRTAAAATAAAAVLAPPGAPATPGAPRPTPGMPGPSLAKQAMQHYNSMLEATRQGDWTRFGKEFEQLGKVLRELAK